MHAHAPCVGVFLALLCLVPAPAEGQDDAAPLRGPEVETQQVPGLRTEYVPGEGARPGERARAAPAQMFFRAVRTLAAESAPADVRLSGEQAAAIRAEVWAFAEELDAYLRAARSRVEELSSRLPEPERRRALREWGAMERSAREIDALDPARSQRERVREAGDRPGSSGAVPGDTFNLDFGDSGPIGSSEEGTMSAGDPAVSGSAPGEIAAELRKIRDAAPHQAELQKRVWARLGPAQREQVEVALRELQAEARARLEERRVALLTEGNSARQGEPATTRNEAMGDAEIQRLVRRIRAGERPERLWSRLPERTRERLERLTPDERATAVERLLRARAGGNRGKKPSDPE